MASFQINCNCWHSLPFHIYAKCNFQRNFIDKILIENYMVLHFLLHINFEIYSSEQ